VRTVSALSSDESHRVGATTSERTFSEPVEPLLGTDRLDIETVGADQLSDNDTDQNETVDQSIADSWPPANIIHRDHCGSASVWRCLGLTPVTSFSIEHKNLSFSYHRKFCVQPVLFSGVVLPHVSIVIK